MELDKRGQLELGIILSLIIWWISHRVIKKPGKSIGGMGRASLELKGAVQSIPTRVESDWLGWTNFGRSMTSVALGIHLLAFYLVWFDLIPIFRLFVWLIFRFYVYCYVKGVNILRYGGYPHLLTYYVSVTWLYMSLVSMEHWRKSSPLQQGQWWKRKKKDNLVTGKPLPN